jgi:hypothetical protein
MRSAKLYSLLCFLFFFAVAFSAHSQCPPVYTFTGEAVGDIFGAEVAPAGDVNNDGYADYLISAWLSDAGGTRSGRVYVYSGQTRNTLYVFTGDTATDFFGISVASAGDVNHDGFADVIIGASGNDAGGNGAGRAYVFSGQTDDTLYVFTGEAVGDGLGRSVASAADVNNDGFADFIIGAWQSDAGGANSGRAYVFSGQNGDTLLDFTGAAAGDHFGTSVSSAGDVNNDGFADIIIGAGGNDVGGIDAGRAYVFCGQTGDTLYIFTGEVTDDRFGTSLASAGDVNNDGFADMIIGASWNDAGGSDAGRAYVFSGQTGDTLHVFTGGAAGDNLGVSVAPAGDFNMDGFADLIVGASGPYGSDAGRAYVFSGQNGDKLYVFTGEAEGNSFGYSVAVAGDVNNDSFVELLVGAPGFGVPGDPEPQFGRAYLFSVKQCNCADADGDTVVTNNDLLLLMSYYLECTAAPNPLFGGDVNCDRTIDLRDIIYLSQYLNGTGPPPCCEQ